MHRNLTHLVWLGLALGLVLTSAAVAADPNLVGWWTLDDGAGTTAIDSSGNGNNGTLTNDPVWVDGRLAGALDFDGTNDYIDCGNPTSLNITGQITLAVWIRPDTAGNGQHQHFLGKGDTSYVIKQFSGNSIEMVVYSGGWRTTTFPVGAAASFNGVWHHLAGTFDGSQIKLYHNGELRGTGSFVGSIAINAATVRIASEINRRYYNGLLDDARIYNRALSESEIRKLADPERASLSIPANGSVITEPQVTLSWDIGLGAASHDVYFGESLADVNSASTTTAAIYKGRQAATQYPTIGTMTLQLGRTYYWRVDEIAADGVTKYVGEVWSFTVQPLNAYNPSPADGAIYVDPDADLAWSKGFKAQSHDVYFGTSQTNVANATTSSAEFERNQTDPNYVLPKLANDTLYYWRVDERNNDATVTQGNVWSFRTIPLTPVTDPNLVGWWKLDDGQGAVALDWSGRGHHGSVVGNPQWVAGQIGGALDLDGVYNAINCGNPADVNITGQITLSAWVKTDAAGNSADQSFVTKMASGEAGGYNLRHVNSNNIQFLIGSTGVLSAVDSSFNGFWHHVAGTYDGSLLKLYIDGALKGTAALGGAIPVSAYNLNIGRDSIGNRFPYNGAIDDVRIYNRALTQEELAMVIRGDPLIAWNPKPANGAVVDVTRPALVRWSPGDKASQHDVYFGADANAVAGATAATADIYRGRQSPTSYTATETLQAGQTYYWRIDEYNTDATVSKGRVWNFVVARYLIVDDFEDYDANCVRLYYTWRDGGRFDANPACGVDAYAGNGTASTVGNPLAEQAINHGGGQSMPVQYFNANPPYYSETQREWPESQDWTRNGVKSLTLWFRGVPANATVPNAPTALYIIIQDTSSKSKTFTHSDPNAALATTWQRWDIDLKDISTAGVNLASIKKMTIGMDNRANVQTAGTGWMYFDDIALYPPRCRADVVKPVCDLNNDCVVDYRDLDLMANDWLLADQVITTAAAATTGLVGYWPLDGNANDASGNGNNGTLSGSPVWVAAGQINGALQVDGVDDFVNCGAAAILDITARVTLSAWVKTADSGNGQFNPFVAKGDTSYGLQQNSNNTVEFYIYDAGTWYNARYAVTNSFNNAWHHVAGTYDGTQLKVYVDGTLRTTTDHIGAMALSTFSVNIGSNSEQTTRYYAGLIDDVRIYSRTLSAAEIAYLADTTPADGRLHVPVQSPADFYSAEPDGSQKINFRDYAVLASAWLEQKLWPQP